jgi:hypothetical protein
MSKFDLRGGLSDGPLTLKAMSTAALSRRHHDGTDARSENGHECTHARIDHRQPRGEPG